jgi:LEA14-like dessication related protein
MPAKLLITTFAIALFTSACAHVPKPVEEPSVDVRGVALTGVSFTGIDGEIHLDVFNPNMFSVPLQAVDWELSVGGASAVSGSFELHKQIPARDSTPVIGSLAIGAADAVAVGDKIADGESRYTVRGTMHFASRLGPITVSFEYDGDFNDAKQAAL